MSRSRMISRGRLAPGCSVPARAAAKSSAATALRCSSSRMRSSRRSATIWAASPAGQRITGSTRMVATMDSRPSTMRSMYLPATCRCS